MIAGLQASKLLRLGRKNISGSDKLNTKIQGWGQGEMIFPYQRRMASTLAQANKTLVAK